MRLPDHAAPGFGERLLVAYARYFPMRRGKLRLVNSLWRPLSARGGARRLARLNHGGYVMSCDLGDMLQRQFYFFGTYFLEDGILRAWSEAARTGRVVFDVGANAGIYSLAAVAANPEATVHAFEPTPEIAARLRATAAANGLGSIRVHELAVFSENTEMALMRWRGEAGDNEGMNFVSQDTTADAAEIVQGVSLDRFCEERGIDRIDLMKIDIQGQEAEALRGAQRLLRARRIGALFLELNWAEPDDGSCPARESVEQLAAADYEFAAPAQRLHFRPAGDWLREHSDIVARPRTGAEQGPA